MIFLGVIFSSSFLITGMNGGMGKGRIDGTTGIRFVE